MLSTVDYFSKMHPHPSATKWNSIQQEWPQLGYKNNKIQAVYMHNRQTVNSDIKDFAKKWNS